MNALRRLAICPECDAVLNAGRVCEACGVLPGQTDIDCQQAVQNVPGALILVRPDTLNPSRIRSDGNGRNRR